MDVQSLWKWLLGDVLAQNGGLTVLLLIGLGWFVWKIASMWLRKEEAETNATVSASDGVDVLKKLLEDERNEKVRLQGELGKANEAYRSLVTSQMQTQEEAIRKVREEHSESIQRIHQRLDDCDRHRNNCEDALRNVVKVLTSQGIKGLPEVP